MMPTLITFLLVFVIVGIGFVMVNLLIGRLFRPTVSNAVKEQPYECGELPVGTSRVQFDLRFYVVALLFVIFEVELVFFFPWASLFGKVNALAATGTTGEMNWTGAAWMLFAEMALFLAVLLVAYAYLWRRGDLNWVRAHGKLPLPTV